MSTIQVRAYVQAGRPIVEKVLQDYARWDRWLPGVERSHLLAVEEGSAFVELSGARLGARPWLLEVQGPLPLQVRRVGSFADRGTLLEVDLIDAEDQEGVQVRARLRDRRPWPGRLFGRRRLRGHLEELLHALDLRAQKAASGWISDGEARATRILELRRDEGGLALVFRGEKYRLEPAADDGVAE